MNVSDKQHDNNTKTDIKVYQKDGGYDVGHLREGIFVKASSEKKKKLKNEEVTFEIDFLTSSVKG